MYDNNEVTILDKTGDPITVRKSASGSVVLTTQYGRQRKTPFVLSRAQVKALRSALKAAL